jgi:cyclic dehypoxanthinyl futalosine synthase
VTALAVSPGVTEVLEKALDGRRLTDEDAVELLRSRDLVAVGRVANELRNRKTDPSRITFIVDRNLNYTNICVTDCDFCAFYRSPGDVREGYLLPKPVIFKKIEETLAIGGTGLLMQGGHHPDLAIDYYEDLFRSIKERYRIHLHALSPPEIQHIARRSKLTVWETLSRLRDAGLDSVPGGGGEILVDRVRDVIAPKKTTSDEWLDVMRHAHRLGMSTTATMMYGHVETLEERVEHMRRIRDLQDETRGFRAFISWTFQRDGNRLSEHVPDEAMPTSFVYLLTQAVSRIYLDNVDHIQSSWVTQGMKVGQVALGFGADDMGSVMMEENVVSAAGTTYKLAERDICRLIRDSGWVPAQRDQYYNVLRRHDGPSSPDLQPVEHPPMRNVKQIDKRFIGAAPGLDDGADRSVGVQLPLLGRD